MDKATAVCNSRSFISKLKRFPPGCTMEFRRSLSLSGRDRRRLLEWGPDIFHAESLELIWRPKQLQLTLYAEEEAVSTCGLLKQSVRIGQRSLQVGGIGGVATPPQHQGKGYARRVLREALRIFSEEWRLDAGMLFCRPELVPFYLKSGWRELDVPVAILQPAGKVDCPVPVMVYPLTGPWLEGPVTIDSLPW